MHLYSSSEIFIGQLAMGGGNPVRLQSMANVGLVEVHACIEQTIRIIDAGAELVRYAVRNMKEVESLELISKELKKEGFHTPLVADVHFNPDVALEAAKYVEKVRVNPGNFAYRPDENISFKDGIKLCREKFIPLLEQCKTCNTAIRIGTNHGSLSRRITEKYGDTPEGMVASVMEYLQICVEYGFYNVVVSLKSSNIKVMIEANRLMAKEMANNGMHFPFHLGVTEAGDSEAGRVKSAAGIGTLLQENIGDTIRVSLTEPPEDELPVAKKIVKFFSGLHHSPAAKKVYALNVHNIGSDNPPVVICSGHDIAAKDNSSAPDYIFFTHASSSMAEGRQYILPYGDWRKLSVEEQKNKYPLFNDIHEFACAEAFSATLNFVYFDVSSFQYARSLSGDKQNMAMVISCNGYDVYETLAHLNENHIEYPLIFKKDYEKVHIEDLQIQLAGDCAPFLVNRCIDGLWVENGSALLPADVLSAVFAVLQATGARVTKTEFIACPSCGRTLFDIQNVLSLVKEKTQHLKGLKIAVMGCVVNGPGEMADADYGYVGSGQGKVTLYRKKLPVKKNIPEDMAVDELINLIRENGDWQEV